MELQSKRYNYFIHALLITATMFLCAIIMILVMGKTGSFLWVNHHYNDFWNFFFTWFTYFGDAWIWLPVSAYFAIVRKEFFWLIIFSVFLSVFFAQFSKHFIFPNEMRPTVELSGKHLVHTIKGIQISKEYSFPSGHTTTAYTLALVLSYIGGRRWLSILLPFIAFGVAWSRVYQGQHFVTDVAAGMFLGMLSAFLSIGLYVRMMHLRQQGDPVNDSK